MPNFKIANPLEWLKASHPSAQAMKEPIVAAHGVDIGRLIRAFPPWLT